jgi:hypothetical protein
MIKKVTKKQRERLAELRIGLDSYARPLRDVDMLRNVVDELLAILLNEPGETGKKGDVKSYRGDDI